MNPQLGKEQRVYATAKSLNAFGTEMRDESLKLQVLLDKKIEDWGFNKDRTGKNLDITVKNKIYIQLSKNGQGQRWLCLFASE